MRNQLYLDTSIPNAYFDNRVPLRQLITQKWFQNDIKDYSIYVSALVLEEINRFRNRELRNNLLDLVLSLKPVVLEVDRKAVNLSTVYLKSGAIPRKEQNAIQAAIPIHGPVRLLFQFP